MHASDQQGTVTTSTRKVASDANASYAQPTLNRANASLLLDKYDNQRAHHASCRQLEVDGVPDLEPFFQLLKGKGRS